MDDTDWEDKFRAAQRAMEQCGNTVVAAANESVADVLENYRKTVRKLENELDLIIGAFTPLNPVRFGSIRHALNALVSFAIRKGVFEDPMCSQYFNDKNLQAASLGAVAAANVDPVPNPISGEPETDIPF